MGNIKNTQMKMEMGREESESERKFFFCVILSFKYDWNMSKGIARASISIIFDEIILMFGFSRFLSLSMCTTPPPPLHRHITFSRAFLILHSRRFVCSPCSTQIFYLFLASDSCRSTSYTLQIIDISCASMLLYRRTLRFLSHSICRHRVRAKFVRRIPKSHYSHPWIVSLSVSKSIRRQQHCDYSILARLLIHALFSGTKSKVK